MEYVQQRNIEKLTRFLDKGLDPNFHDPDTGGKNTSHPSLVCHFSIFNLHLPFFVALSLYFFPCLRNQMTMHGFSEISLLHAALSWITLSANLLKFMQIIVQAIKEISLLGDL